jgi:hypothetical protein
MFGPGGDEMRHWGEAHMTDLDEAWMPAKRLSFDRLWRSREAAELLGMLGGCLWVTLIFVVVHFGKG